MKINTAALLNALKIAKPGLAEKEWIEQTRSFAFRNGMVITYNDELSISHPVPFLEDMTGAINGQELYNLLDKITHDTIDMDIDDNQVQVRVGRLKAGIPINSEILLPLAEVDAPKDWVEIPSTLIEALKFSIYGLMNPNRSGQRGYVNDPSSVVLGCVHITQTILESSDNIRLTRFRLDGKMPRYPLLIPARTAKELISYPIKWTSANESNSWVHFKTEDETVLSCRTVSAEYPDIAQIADVEGQEVQLPPSLVDILTKAQVFSLTSHPLDEEVEVNIGDKRIVIRSQSEHGSWFEESIRFIFDGEPVTFTAHPLFLKDICQRPNTCIIAPDRLKFYGEGWEYVLALKGGD